MSEQDRRVFDSILSSFENIGRTKAVGYLPRYTITDVLHESIESRAKTLAARGFGVRIFNEGETCIKSGAVFAYDPAMMSRVINKHLAELTSRDWTPSAAFVIEQIAIEWFDENDPIMPFIKDLFGDN